jgi:putative acetyltransferase
VTGAPRIRPARDDDATAIAAVHRRSIEGLAGRHYTPPQVAAWAARSPSAEAVRERIRDGRTALVAVDAGDRPVAFGDVEPDGHIAFLFCAPEAAGRGVAGALCDRLEEAARAHGATVLRVEASAAARGLFLRRGFHDEGRRDLDLDGVAIHNHAMRKDL